MIISVSQFPGKVIESREGKWCFVLIAVIKVGENWYWGRDLLSVDFVTMSHIIMYHMKPNILWQEEEAHTNHVVRYSALNGWWMNWQDLEQLKKQREK